MSDKPDHVDPILVGLLDEVLALKAQNTELTDRTMSLAEVSVKTAEVVKTQSDRINALENPIVVTTSHKLFWVRDNDEIWTCDYQHAIPCLSTSNISNLLNTGYSEVTPRTAKAMGLYT